MTEQALNMTDVSSVVDHVSGERVAQLMRRHPPQASLEASQFKDVRYS